MMLRGLGHGNGQSAGDVEGASAPSNVSSAVHAFSLGLYCPSIGRAACLRINQKGCSCRDPIAICLSRQRVCT